MRKLALLLSLLALGTLGLVAFAGDDDETIATSKTEAPAESETEATSDELAVGNKYCGALYPDPNPPLRPAVVEGDISCRVAREVMYDWANGRLSSSWFPGYWDCAGLEANVVCAAKPGASPRIVIRARFASEAAAVDADPGNENRVSDEERIEQKANEWALLFAKADPATCGYYEGQPACEREECRYISGYRIKNCTPLSSEFRKSFASATVERVVVEGRRATAEFSNGESVEFAGGMFRTTGGLWGITVNTVKNFEQ